MQAEANRAPDEKDIAKELEDKSNPMIIKRIEEA